MHDVGASFESFLQRWQETDVAAITTKLGEPAVELGRAAGQQFSRSEAVALARDILIDYPS